MKQSKPKPSAAISGGTEPGFTLKKLRHDDYHEICGLVESIKTMPPDSDVPQVSDSLELWTPGALVSAMDGWTGRLTGFAIDVDTMEPSRYARVNGRLYHLDVLKRA